MKNEIAHAQSLIVKPREQAHLANHIESKLPAAYGPRLLQLGNDLVQEEYWDLARAGKAAESSKKHYELQLLRDVWKSIYGSLWNKKGATHPLPYIKYWMELNGMCAGPVCPPMHNIGEREKTEFRERLEGSGWLARIAPKQAKRVAA
ncbi:MAG TPA: hypothetical protein VGO18_14200 [Steroidobacteraceae bacterium]|nr:hypothetical protein [Steroidobacteraceae bacterium]